MKTTEMIDRRDGLTDFRGTKASKSSTCALNILLEAGAWRNGKGILVLKAVFVATASRPPRARITRQEVVFETETHVTSKKGFQ